MDPQAYRLIALRSALALEIKCPGMKATRAALLPICKQYGINARTKKAAYKELNALMVANGFEDKPLPE